MLGAPAAGVGRIHPDDRDPAAGGYAAQPGAQLCGGNAGDGAAQPFPAPTAAQGFPPGGARVGEVEVSATTAGAAAVLGVVEQLADGRAHPPITPGCSQPGGIEGNGDGCTDRADPTTDQHRAFDLLDTPIPLTTAAYPEQKPHQTSQSPGQPGDSPISAAVNSD